MNSRFLGGSLLSFVLHQATDRSEQAMGPVSACLRASGRSALDVMGVAMGIRQHWPLPSRPGVKLSRAGGGGGGRSVAF